MTAAISTVAPQPALVKPLYEQLQPRRGGLDQATVARHQRLRLIGAMIEVTGSSGGYPAANIKLLSGLAGVSRQTFYDRFGTLEECFLAAYDSVVDEAIELLRARIHSSNGRSKGHLVGMPRAFAEFAAEIAGNPNAAELVLVAALSAGPRATARMQDTKLVFEEIVLASFRNGGVELPPVIGKGIVCGVERIARQHLITGRAPELTALGDDLGRWVLSFYSLAGSRLCAAVRVSPRTAPGPVSHGHASERTRVLRACARLAADRGYKQTTPKRIIVAAGVSEETFEAMYQSTEQCFLASLSLLATEALKCAKGASQTTGNPLGGVHLGMIALLEHLARDPVLQRVAFVEVFAVGRPAVERRTELLQKFKELLLKRVPEPLRPTDVTAEAIVGSIWGIVHHHVTHGTAHLLPELAGHLSYLALAPVIGGEAAIQCICAAEEPAD